MKTGATLNRGNSNQAYETPDNFIAEVVKKFGALSYDLAASKLNTRADKFFDKDQNSLTQDWNAINGNLWLNPPFDNITPWAKKCSEYRGIGSILFLVPASCGSNWFRDFVYPFSKVYFLNGRLTFKGCNDPYPKDCILAHFENKVPTGQTEIWRWRGLL